MTINYSAGFLPPTVLLKWVGWNYENYRILLITIRATLPLPVGGNHRASITKRNRWPFTRALEKLECQKVKCNFQQKNRVAFIDADPSWCIPAAYPPSGNHWRSDFLRSSENLQLNSVHESLVWVGGIEIMRRSEITLRSWSWTIFSRIFGNLNSNRPTLFKWQTNYHTQLHSFLILANFVCLKHGFLVVVSFSRPFWSWQHVVGLRLWIKDFCSQIWLHELFSLLDSLSYFTDVETKNNFCPVAL